MESINVNPENSSNIYYPTIWWDTSNYTVNPTILIIILAVIIISIMLFFSLGNNNGNNEDNSLFSSSDNYNNGSNYSTLFSTLIIFMLVLFFLINIFLYYFNINISTFLKNIFTNRPELDIVIEKNNVDANNLDKNISNLHNLQDDLGDHKYATFPKIINKEQVFNVPGNYYTYEDAKSLCKAYGSNLATYQQVEEAYASGAEWCNYGWSDGQMALFPTQQKTFNNLQKIPGHEHDCGRPGINGGYIANPNVKYGVNCYGVKPNMRTEEEELMKIASPYPKTQKDIDFQNKVDYWKTKIDEILISPFNYSSWNG